MKSRRQPDGRQHQTASKPCARTSCALTPIAPVGPAASIWRPVRTHRSFDATGARAFEARQSAPLHRGGMLRRGSVEPHDVTGTTPTAAPDNARFRLVMLGRLTLL